MTKSLHRQIVSLGQRVEAVVAARRTEERKPRGRTDSVKDIIADIQDLLDRIDREVPLLQLAISASGESLASSLPSFISPSRLLQASTLLTLGDSQFAQEPTRPVQIGPSFSLSVYMLFVGHSAGLDTPGGDSRPYGLGPGQRRPIWQEVVHKARVSLSRASTQALEYEYYLDIIEDHNDDRAHGSGPTDVLIQERVPIREIAKLFYTDSGKLLNIGSDGAGGKNPILLLKRDVDSSKQTSTEEAMIAAYGAELLDDREAENDSDTQDKIDRQIQEESFVRSSPPPPADSARFPHHLDPEWIAVEMFQEDGGDKPSTDSEDSADEQGSTCSSDDESGLDVIGCMAIHPPLEEASTDSTETAIPKNTANNPSDTAVARSPLGAVTTSLSLIEMLIRLASLQEFQQTSHLSIPDHVMTFFLEEASTTGLMGEAQKRARAEAERTVGFDPYNNSTE